VEPSNNHTRRVVDPDMLWGKSAPPCWFVERMPTVAQTKRL